MKIRLSEHLTDIIIILITFVMPLYADDGYFNMLESKNFVLYCIGTVLSFAIVVGNIERLKNGIKLSWRKVKKKISLLDISVILLAVSVYISMFISYDFRHAFLGDKGWYMGGLAMTICTILYFYITIQGVELDKCMKCLLISSCIVYIIGITEYFGVDVLNFHQNMQNKVTDYISTIGNITWMSGYMAILFPMSMMQLLNETEQKLNPILLYSYIGMEIFILCVLGTDSGVLVLYVTLAGMFLLCLEKEKYIKRFLSVMIITGCVYGIIWLLHLFSLGNYDYISKYHLWVVEKYIWVIFLVGCTFTKWLLFGNKLKNVMGYCIANRRKIRWISCLLGAGVMILYIMNMIKHFDMSWGTNRGYIWTNAIKMFREFKLQYKLFGCGIDCFGVMFQSFCGKNHGVYYLNAHNEFLQYLITLGLFGVAVIGCICIGIINKIKKNKRDLVNRTVVFVVIVYGIQSLFNNPVSTNYVLLFLLLGIMSYHNNIHNIVIK